ncbi:MAG: LacI family DNA-binding transcriptional regulator [Chthoniobacteraceae bacterium]
MSNSQPKPRNITLNDIARVVGLSHAAVSLALRNNPEVSKQTCARVQAAAKEMGYQPNPVATALARFKKTSREKPIHSGLAWLNFWADPKKLRSYKEFDLYWKGAVACGEKFGYRVEEFVVNEQMPMNKLERILLTRDIQGILVPPGELPENLVKFDWSRFSIVHVGRSDPKVSMHCVAADQIANAMLAYDRLREKGYQRIGFVGNHWRPVYYGAGFLWAQTESQSAQQIPPLFVKQSSSADLKKALGPWLKKNRPEAIVTDLAILKAVLTESHEWTPDKIGLAASTVLDCPITAGINQNSEEIGRVSVLLLMSLIYDNDRGIPETNREVLVKGKWVDGSDLPGW